MARCTEGVQESPVTYCKCHASKLGLVGSETAQVKPYSSALQVAKPSPSNHLQIGELRPQLATSIASPQPWSLLPGVALGLLPGFK